MTQPTHQILVIEDEHAIRAVLRVLLAGEGYMVIEADTAMRGETAARDYKPDLLLLDLGLPDRDGLEVIRDVRAWSPVPIIVVSARTLEEHKMLALDAGADDYLTKPFSAPALIASVRAGLRRRGAETGQPVLQFGATRVDLRCRTLQAPGEDIHLTPAEYRVLERLARQRGMVVRQSELLCEVWASDRTHDARALRAAINSLRAKLEPDPCRPRYLLTEIGLGYRLCPTEDSPVSVRPSREDPEEAEQRNCAISSDS